MQNFRSPHYNFVLMKEGVSVILSVYKYIEGKILELKCVVCAL